MPPSPLSLLWPTMLMPKKLYFSVLLRRIALTPQKHHLNLLQDTLRLKDKETSGVYGPMLRVTVMMFKDIVESVTLLKEDAWSRKPQI